MPDFGELPPDSDNASGEGAGLDELRLKLDRLDEMEEDSFRRELTGVVVEFVIVFCVAGLLLLLLAGPFMERLLATG
ncbi:MAG: hypothetical protein C4534_05555 [Gaiellales bacterium]|nr:MAG: hypothetical protein C4534_05555 [Gaiellales bacterium]